MRETKVMLYYILRYYNNKPQHGTPANTEVEPAPHRPRDSGTGVGVGDGGGVSAPLEHRQNALGQYDAPDPLQFSAHHSAKIETTDEHE